MPPKLQPIESLRGLPSRSQLLDLALESSPMIVWAFDREGTITLLEGKGLEGLRSREALRVGVSVFDVYRDLPPVLECVRRALAGEEFNEVLEVRGIVFETRYCPLRDSRGQVIGASGLSIEVTERERVAAAHRESEEKFKRIFDSSLDAVVLSDVNDGRYLEVNDEFENLTGFRREEVIGRTPIELGIWQDPGNLEERRQEIRHRRVVRNVESAFRRKDGSERWALYSAVIVEIGGHSKLLSFVRDITERRRVERSLRELSGRLLQLQDQERRRIALELHDSTAQTLAALAMNLALVAAALDGSPSPERSALEASIALADQCSQEIRTLSYLLHPPLLDEVGLASALRHFVRGFADRSGIEVSCDLPEDLERLPREIETTLFRVVQESLTNIHRHSGSPVARISLKKSAKQVILEVRDRGRGLPAPLIEGSSDFPKVGVGIPGMRERVRQLGGRLDVDSHGRGVTIKVLLPLRRAHA